MAKTLLEFAEPLTETAAAWRNLEELRARLQFAAVVWNAVIEAEGDPIEAFTELVLDMKVKTGEIPPALAILGLSKRKADDFRADARLFGFVDVQVRRGRVCLMASSRRRSSFRNDLPTA